MTHMPCWLNGSNPWFPRNTPSGRRAKNKGKRLALPLSPRLRERRGRAFEHLLWPEGLLYPSPKTRRTRTELQLHLPEAFGWLANSNWARGDIDSQRPDDFGLLTKS